MFGKPNKKTLFNLIGVTIVSIWLIMMGLLIKKVQFGNHPTDMTYGNNTIAIEEAQREWKEIFFKGKKSGYSVSMLKPFQDGYFIQEEIFLRLNLMGMGRDLYMITQTQVDTRFLLKNFYFKIKSGIVQFHFTGNVEGDQLVVKTGMGKNQRVQTIQLKKAPMMGAGIGYFFKSRDIHVGDSFTIPMFDPTTMTQKEAVIRVTAREPLTINRIAYQAYRLETVMWDRPMTFWIDEDGTTLKEEGFMGLTTIKSSAANAPLDIESGTDDDFYEMTSVTIDKALPDPARLSYLKLKILGLDHTVAPEEFIRGGDDRQRFHQDIVELYREKAPYKASYSLPKDDWDSAFRAFLEPELNIESDSKVIQEKVQEIVKDNNNPVAVARKLMVWVYGNLEKKPVVSIPSALEVLRTRVGDCNEHATLLCAMLRAAGIPARISVGLVYSQNRFYYHAWTEAYIGQWLSMDATLNQMPADVSHIRMVRGNVDQQVEIMGLIGRISFKLLDYKL